MTNKYINNCERFWVSIDKLLEVEHRRVSHYLLIETLFQICENMTKCMYEAKNKSRKKQKHESWLSDFNNYFRLDVSEEATKTYNKLLAFRGTTGYDFIPIRKKEFDKLRKGTRKFYEEAKKVVERYAP